MAFGCVLIFLLPCLALAAVHQDLGICQKNLSDVVFGQNLLWVMASKSRGQCAVFCMSNPECVTFTVRRISIRGGKWECYGHSISSFNLTTATLLPGTRMYKLQHRTRLHAVTNGSSTPLMSSCTPVMTSSTPVMKSSTPVMKNSTPVMKSSTPVMNSSPSMVSSPTPVMNNSTPTMKSSIPAMGSSIPVIKSSIPVMKSSIPAMGSPTTDPNEPFWLESPCRTDADCPAEESACFSMMCLCNQGYYYSFKSNTCVRSCGSSDLLNKMVSYPKYYLQENNDLQSVASTLDECINLCLQDSRCRSLDWSNNKFCTTSTRTALDDPDSWTSMQSMQHSQKLCA